MREIKFRAWLIKEKIMANSNEYLNNESNNWNIKHIYSERADGLIDMVDIDILGSYEIENEAILMQYTGLKDKNGVEIYEGDILSSENNKLYNKIDIVRFINNIGAFMISVNNEDRHLPLYSFSPESFIIGNIYENPELLNENTAE